MDAPGLTSDALPAEAPRDGRRLRRERNREAIVAALAEILGGGNLEPTADEVAARAGVQVRTLFRHFPDMASLHAEIAGRLRAEVIPLLAAVPTEGDPVERVRRLVQARAAAFERVAPFKRAGDVLRWRLDFLQEHHARIVRDLRHHLLAVLPELRAARPAVQAALELVTSFEAWNRLRVEQRLSAERACEAMERAAFAIFASAVPGESSRRSRG